MNISLKDNTDPEAAHSLYTTILAADSLVHTQPFSAGFLALENQHNILHQCLRGKCH